MEDPREEYYQKRLRHLDSRWRCHEAARSTVVLSVLHTHDCLDQVLSQNLQPFGLSGSAFNLLAILEKQENRCLPLHEIGRLMVTSRANITGLIDSLVRRGLVERIPHESDRRIKLARLLPAGQELLERIFPSHLALVERVTEQLTEEESLQLVALLKKLRVQALACSSCSLSP